MKKIGFTAMVIIILGTALTLYLRWDLNRFAESLPKAPLQTHIEQPTDMRTQGNVSENEKGELPAKVNTLSAPTSTSVEASNDTAHRPPDHSGFHSDVHAPPIRVEGQQKDEVVKQEDESTLSFMDLSLEEIIERNRQKLIEKHGDIPEIDIYLRLNAPLFEAIKNREAQVKIQRTLEEHLEFSRVMSVLYPSEEHDKMYQAALQEVEKRRRRR